MAFKPFVFKPKKEKKMPRNIPFNTFNIGENLRGRLMLKKCLQKLEHSINRIVNCYKIYSKIQW
jgi:hypothetical protein